MPSPERGGHNPETEPPQYYQAARFTGEQPAGDAYFEAQDLIYGNPDCDLSAYRLQFNHIWHVLVLGDPPPEALKQEIKAILSTGQPTSLPLDLLNILKIRREIAIKQGPWVERHHRPGKRF